uniref:Uncharacterized protein n=1 Tax=Anguilla anguilla TaxID=7936 RepID=A0A0E9UCK2_ANGAN
MFIIRVGSTSPTVTAKRVVMATEA